LAGTEPAERSLEMMQILKKLEASALAFSLLVILIGWNDELNSRFCSISAV
jgi:hypothetical protein